MTIKSRSFALLRTTTKGCHPEAGILAEGSDVTSPGNTSFE
ncbi:hypothetical protein [Aminivibrio sp.]